MDNLFFSSWESVGRTVVIGLFAYGALVLMLRVSGNRTLSQLNAFDLIVTVALGSTLATVILSRNVALMDGIVALALLIAMQMITSLLSVYFISIRKLIKTEPRLLFYRGVFLDEALKKHRITEDEILQTARAKGFGNLNDVDAIVLETNGRFSVIGKLSGEGRSTLQNVFERKPPAEEVVQHHAKD